MVLLITLSTQMIFAMEESSCFELGKELQNNLEQESQSGIFTKKYSRYKNPSGLLTVICGPMFSGKTTCLISKINASSSTKKNILIFKHVFDDRYKKLSLESHCGDTVPCHPIKALSEIFKYLISATEIIDDIFIDEVQFFEPTSIFILPELRDRGINITVSGLDLDFRGIPFGPMPDLLALADNIFKLKAICAKTEKEAQYSQRLINGNPAKHTDPILLIGGSESYEPRNRDAFEINYVPLYEYLKERFGEKK